MSKTLIAALLGASALSFAGAANAVTTINFTSFQAAPNPGETMVTGFETPIQPDVLADVIFALSGYSLSGTGALLTGSSSAGAAPAFSTSTQDTTQYLSLEKGQFADLTTPLLSTVSFYVGSLDGFNSVTFTHQDLTTETFTGAAIDSLFATVDANGDQHASNSNGRLSFTFSNPVTDIHLASASNSFEISNVATTLASLVPEPASWTLMMMGIGGAGAVIRRRRALMAVHRA
jgi:hypothetical protein